MTPTSVFTLMTPSSVKVLVSTTGNPSACKSINIFWEHKENDARYFQVSVSKSCCFSNRRCRVLLTRKMSSMKVLIFSHILLWLLKHKLLGESIRLLQANKKLSGMF